MLIARGAGTRSSKYANFFCVGNSSVLIGDVVVIVGDISFVARLCWFIPFYFIIGAAAGCLVVLSTLMFLGCLLKTLLCDAVLPLPCNVAVVKGGITMR